METKKIVIKSLHVFYGAGLIILGLGNLISVFFVLKNFSIKDILAESLYTKGLILAYLIFYIYLIIVGIVVFCEKKGVYKGAIFLPFLFIILRYFYKPNETLGSYIIWLVFLFSLALFSLYVKFKKSKIGVTSQRSRS